MNLIKIPERKIVHPNISDLDNLLPFFVGVSLGVSLRLPQTPRRPREFQPLLSSIGISRIVSTFLKIYDKFWENGYVISKEIISYYLFLQQEYHFVCPILLEGLEMSSLFCPTLESHHFLYVLYLQKGHINQKSTCTEYLLTIYICIVAKQI